MLVPPDFLPPILDLQGTWEEILARLYAVFSRDFRANKVKHRGMRIIYNGRVMPDGHGKEEGFWHVVSKQERSSGERLIDYRRAERLPWARPKMESAERDEIMAKTKTRSYDAAEYLETPEDMAAYLEAALEDGEPTVVVKALGTIARARDTGLWRESLYKAFSPEGNPEFATVLKVVRALGLKLHAEPEHA